MNIAMAHPSEADALTEIAFAAKRHWGYPEHWLEHWRSVLAVSPDFIINHETLAARDEQHILGFAALVEEGDLLWLEHLWVLPAAMGRGVGRAELNGARERCARDFRKTQGCFLERSVLDRGRGEVTPALDPAAAEMAIAVKDQERPGWRVAHGAMGRGRHQRRSNDEGRASNCETCSTDSWSLSSRSAQTLRPRNRNFRLP